MSFNPKDAWKSVKILYAGKTSHHKHPTIMMMWLTDRNTTTTDADNSLVLGPYFAKVFCANLTFDWSILTEVRQIDVMQEIDQPISWD